MDITGKFPEVVMFFKKKQHRHGSYDHENKKPVIRASICTGEQVAGFRDVHTGAFEEIMLSENMKTFIEKRVYNPERMRTLSPIISSGKNISSSPT